MSGVVPALADAYHALADNGYLDNTVLIVTFDEWGGFYDHVRPPQVIDDTNPADVMHAGDSTTPTDGQLYPNYSQLGFRVPGIVVTNLARPHRVVHEGPFEHDALMQSLPLFGTSVSSGTDSISNLRPVTPFWSLSAPSSEMPWPSVSRLVAMPPCPTRMDFCSAAMFTASMWSR